HERSNFSNENELLVGFDGFEKDAAYLHYNGALAGLAGKYIYSAEASLYNTHSWSCRPAAVALYPVTQPWSGSTMTSYPGQSYDSQPMTAPLSAAYGHPDCPGPNWLYFGLDGARVTAWAQGLEPFYGFTVRASETDTDG